MEKLSPFSFLNSINTGKRGKNLMENVRLDYGDGVPPFDSADRSYVPFIINRGLSQHEDTILFSNEMNQRAAVPEKMQYDFYRFAVRPRKRFGKFAKGTKDDDVVEAMIELYKINRIVARESVLCLTNEQKKNILESVNKGGK